MKPTSKNVRPEGKEGKEQLKYIIDLRKRGREEIEYVHQVLCRCNDKETGRLITATDLFLYLLEKLTAADVQKIQELSLDEWDLIRLEHQRHLKKHQVDMSLEEFLLKKLRPSILKKQKNTNQSLALGKSL